MPVLESVLLLAFIGLAFRLGMAAGREAYRRELARQWRQAACAECGQEPRPRILHVSGCESGWPDPGKLFDGGR